MASAASASLEEQSRSENAANHTPVTDVDPIERIESVLKVMIVGNTCVGKTCFLLRFAEDKFQDTFASTVGLDFKVKTIKRGDRTIKLQIWDTAGQERYRSITNVYYRTAMGFLLVYDITDENSFRSVQDWATAIKNYSWENTKVVLVGNKNDREEDRQITTTDGQKLASQLNFMFIETSAKDGLGVHEAFFKLADAVCDAMAESLSRDKPKTGTFVRPEANTEEKKNKCWC